MTIATEDRTLEHLAYYARFHALIRRNRIRHLSLSSYYSSSVT